MKIRDIIEGIVMLAKEYKPVERLEEQIASLENRLLEFQNDREIFDSLMLKIKDKKKKLALTVVNCQTPAMLLSEILTALPVDFFGDVNKIIFENKDRMWSYSALITNEEVRVAKDLNDKAAKIKAQAVVACAFHKLVVPKGYSPMAILSMFAKCKGIETDSLIKEATAVKA